MRKRRDISEFSLSFLDVICCGFGAIILLLMIVKTVEPAILEKTVVNLNGQVATRKNAIFELRGQTEVLRQQVSEQSAQLDATLQTLAKLRQDRTNILGQFVASTEDAEDALIAQSELAAARQSLTDEMERLLGQDFRRTDNTIAGIPVDSEYIIFVIDTSGSMQNFAWPQVVRKVSETLQIYPSVKGIQVMNDMGDYMFPNYRGQWIPDSPARRNAIAQRMQSWAPFSNSSPVEGIQAAISTFYAPDKRISIYVFGDDFTGSSVESVVDAVDRINVADADGRRRVRIHAVAFPVHLQNPSGRIWRFAALMRELAHRNDGTFVGLQDLR